MKRDFWENVQFLLKLNKISQIELAERTGINLYTLRNSFVRKPTPYVDLAYKIAQFFNVSIEFLYTGIDKNNDIQKLKNSCIERKKIGYEEELKQKLDSLSELK